MKLVTKISALGALLLFVGTSWAAPTVVFQDNFNAEGPPGANYNSFANWTVSDGTVDLIGATYWNGPPHAQTLWPEAPSQNAVDTDGSSQNAGKITSTVLALGPGSYVLQFALRGNLWDQNDNTVDVEVTGGLFSDSYTYGQTDGPQLISEPFTVAAATNASIVFEGTGADNMGLLLDNVKLMAVPAPGAILLGGIGVGLVGWLRRKRTL